METWQTFHEREGMSEATVTITWRWSARDHRGRKLPTGHYQAVPVAVEFSLFVDEEDQDVLMKWIRTRNAYTSK